MNRFSSFRRLLPRAKWVIALLVLCAAAPLARYAVVASLGLSPVEESPLVCDVVRRDFFYDISVEGEMESAVNEEVRCEVRSQSSYFVRILEVIPEGTFVHPGDVLVRLDSTGLEADRDRQKVVCEQAKAWLIQAGAKCEAAKRARQSYLEGEYQLDRDAAGQELLIARDRERTAREFLACSRKLAAEGYITDLQLRADEYAATAAKTALAMAQIKLAVLENFSRPMKLTQLTAAAVTAKAKLAAAEVQYKFSMENLAQIEEQIKKCVVRAHTSGQVVLAHLFHNGHAHMVESGETTMEKRVLVRLPDFHHMQVAAKIDEDKIALVRPGMNVTVGLEAFPDVEIPGRVAKINEYPEPEDWYGSPVQQYRTVIQIDPPPSGTRPGMSAEVKVHLECLKDRLQVPAPAVFKHGDHDYCITFSHGQWQARKVSIGPTNGTNYVIREGLKEGEQVVLSAAAHKDKVALPPLPKKTLVAGAVSSASSTIVQANSRR